MILITEAEVFATLRAAWSGVRAWINHWQAGQIQITCPGPLQFLEDKQPLDEVRFSYVVRGKLKRLPSREHEIWLLTEDPSGCVWPQGFSPVQFDEQKGEWVGRIHTRQKQPKIVAVVASPTSKEFFKYYQRMGSKTGYEPLTRVPADCTNKVSVQARLPP
jgi:hypothetical protein